MSKIQILNGVNIAFQRWGIGNPKPAVCLHGWLDNSNSFSYLGPRLAEQGFDVVALDHIGHGLSDQIGGNTLHQFSSYASHVKGALDTFGWDKCSFVGHSMGAAVSMLFSGCYPERVEKLVLLDIFGPMTKNPAESPKTLRRAIDMEHKTAAKSTKSKLHATVAAAIQARMRTVASYPGSQTLSFEAASTLIARGVVRVTETEEISGQGHVDLTDPSIGPVRFRHDPKLLLPSYFYFSNDQVD